MSVRLKSQIGQEFSDTVSYKIILTSSSAYHLKKPLILTSDKEYFDFYFNSFGTYPKDFRFNFDKEMIVVFFETRTSGSFNSGVDHVIETQDKIIVTFKIPVNEWRTGDMNPHLTVLSLKKSDKQIVMN
jgi:hypothetical protein